MILPKIILLVVLIAYNQVKAQDDDFIDDSDALNFLEREADDMSLLKRFFYSGPEQRREVREKYEEKCERSWIHKSRPRWCPELDTWPEWAAVSKGDPPHKKLTAKSG